MDILYYMYMYYYMYYYMSYIGCSGVVQILNKSLEDCILGHIVIGCVGGLCSLGDSIIGIVST